MMKQRICNLSALLLCLVFSVTSNLNAQTNNCKRDFTIKTSIVDATCAANGTVTVTLEGDLSELDMSKTRYGLEPAAGSSGSSKLPSENNPITSVAPGTYTLSVRTYCKTGDTNGVVTELHNVVVGGSYTAPMAEYDQNRSIPAYTGLPTGKIAFNVKLNTGNGTLRYYILEAPEGVQLGEFTPTGYSAAGYYRYTMPERYPPGIYKIQILDDCGGTTSIFNFTESLNELPSPVRGGPSQYFHPINDGSCNKAGLSLPSSRDLGSHAGEYQKDGMYEVAVVPKGQTPSESDWYKWEDSGSGFDYGSKIQFTLPDGTRYDDYYVKSNPYRPAVRFDIYTRLKDFPDFQRIDKEAKYMSNLSFSVTSTPDYYCDRVEIEAYIDGGFVCYPLHLKVYDAESGEVYATLTQVENYDHTKIPVPYDRTIAFDYVDALGETNRYQITRKYAYKRDFSANTTDRKCDSFKVMFNFHYNNTYYCDPAIIHIYKADASGEYTELVKTITKNFSDGSSSTPYETYPSGKYKAIASFPNVVTDNPQTVEVLFENVRKIFSYTLSTNDSNCKEKEGAIIITLGDKDDRLGVGATYTVVEAPEGYSLLGVVNTVIGLSSYNGVSTPSAHMPSGKYTVEINDGCGDIQRVSAIFNDVGYSAENVKVVVDESLCEGAYLTLDGMLTLKGENKPDKTWFKLEKGPVGYDKNVKAYNGKILLTADGEYIVSIITSKTAAKTCIIKSDTINYVKSAPLLAPAVTSAYKCEDNPEPFIIVKGIGGTSPYTYELLNMDLSPTGSQPIDIADGSDRIYFEYGESNKSYIVRITDNCGNFSDQEIYVTDLATQSIIYNIPASGEYCSGDTIRLNCITLGQTQYKWEGPNGFISYEQNPRIFPTDPAIHTGTYKVTVTPELCGEPITDEVYVEIFYDLAITGVSEDQEICAASLGEAMSCTTTGGKGRFKYQWQLSTDKTNWTDISGATAATYKPVHTKSGVYYYRTLVADDCRKLYSDAITVTVKACHIPVNPNLMNRVQSK